FPSSPTPPGLRFSHWSVFFLCSFFFCIVSLPSPSSSTNGIHFCCSIQLTLTLLFSLQSTEKTQTKKRSFRKFSYRGTDLENLLDLSNEQLVELLPARARRHFSHRGLRRKHLALVKKLRAAVRSPFS